MYFKNVQTELIRWTGGMAGTQGYFEKSDKVYLGWHFGVETLFGGIFPAKKVGVYLTL